MAETTSVGAVTVDVTVEDHTEAQMAIIRLNVRNALEAMANATLQRSRMLAPMSAIPNHSGTLRTNGRVESTSEGFDVVYGGTADVPYARYQEFGSEDWHFTTPGTGPHYLSQAGESVKREGVRNYL